MDIAISDSQINNLFLTVSITDVLDCIRKDYNNYLNFIKQELKNNDITKEEYLKEMELINKLRKEETV